MDVRDIHDNFRYLDLLSRPLGAWFNRKRLQCIQYVFAANQFPEDGVLLVKMCGGTERDVELRAVRRGALVGHRDDASAVMLRGISQIVLVPEWCAPT